MATPAF